MNLFKKIEKILMNLTNTRPMVAITASNRKGRSISKSIPNKKRFTLR